MKEIIDDSIPKGKCVACGRLTEYNSHFCNNCRRLLLEGSTYTPHELLGGKHKKDFRGRHICKLCGMSFKSMNIHLPRRHGITVEQYVVMFGLERQYNIIKTDLYRRKIPEKTRKKWLEKAYEHKNANEIIRRLRKKANARRKDE